MKDEFNVLTYERVSTDDQKNTPSCNDQKTVNDRFIKTNGWKLPENADFRDEGISGSTLDRPGLQDLLIRCEEDKTIKAVIVTETDRLARGNDAYIPIRAMLKKFGIKVFAVTQPMINDTEEGEMFGEILAAINGFFSKMTRRKSMRALDEKAARGWYPSKAPYGYKNVNIGTEEKPDRIIEVNEEEAVYVRQIPKLYNQGLSFQEIADRFYEQGAKGHQNGRISANEIRIVLFNDFYIGEFKWRGKKYKGKHTPLFSYFEVQKARNRSKEKYHVHPTVELRDRFLFRRLPFFCADCNCRITAEMKVKHYKRTNRTAEYIFYHCTKSKGGWKVCTQPSINGDDLINELAEKAVKPIDLGDDLAEFLLEELDSSIAFQKEEQERLLKQMNLRLGQIDAEVKNLFEMRVAGKIVAIGEKTPDEVYEEYMTKKDIERKNILKAQKNLLEGNDDWKQKASNFFSYCNNATYQFKKAKEDKQYNFVRKVSSNLLLNERKIDITHRFPFSELALWNAHPTVLRD